MKLYIVDLRTVEDSAETRKMLSGARKAKLDRLKQEKSRRACIGAELALIQAVRENIKDVKIPIEWTVNENGKPYLPNHPDFHYNISHSGDYAVCAVGESETGVDIQEYRKPDMRLAKRRYTEAEYEYTKENPQPNFFRIWSRKESVLKAAGIGITIALNSFSVLSDELTLLGKRYRITDVAAPEDGYALSVCEEIRGSEKRE